MDLGAHPVGSERARQQLLDGPLEAGLVGQAVLFRVARDEALLVARAAPRQQVAALVDQRDPLGSELRHRRRHEVLDCEHLAPGKQAAARHLEGDGGARLEPLAPEELTLPA